MEKVEKEWHVERIVFVSVFGVIIGVIVAFEMNAPMGLIIGPLCLASPYFISEWIFGVGGFKRIKTESKGFDFKKFLMEPLILLGVGLLALIPIGIIGLFKNCGN